MHKAGRTFNSTGPFNEHPLGDCLRAAIPLETVGSFNPEIASLIAALYAAPAPRPDKG